MAKGRMKGGTVWIGLLATGFLVLGGCQSNRGPDPAPPKSASQAAQPAKSPQSAPAKRATAKPSPAPSSSSLEENYRRYQALRDKRKLEEAELALRQVIGMAEREWGAEAAEVADLWGQLGVLYTDLERYREAERAFMAAKAIQDKTLTADDPRVAMLIHNMGELYRESGRYSQALTHFEHALAMMEKIQGKESKQVAIILTNMALLHRNQNKLTQAERLFRQALDLHEKVLPPGHYYITETLRSLVEIASLQGRPRDAEAYYARLLAQSQARSQGPAGTSGAGRNGRPGQSRSDIPGS